MNRADLLEIEQRVQRLLRGQRHDLLQIGAGEVSVVLGWPTEQPVWACKRLPPLSNLHALKRHQSLVVDYEETLRTRGISYCPSGFYMVPSGNKLTALYMVQRLLPRHTLLSTVLRDTPVNQGLPRSFAGVLAAIDRVDARFGLDAQVSNWAETESGISLIDTTTPFLRDERGRDRLDAEFLLRPYPAPMRAIVRSLLLKRILAAYHDPQQVALDLLANLYRERLQAWVEPASQVIGRRYGKSISPQEALAYYRSNIRMWRVLDRARRVQRFVYRRVLRDTYPFVLPD